jgi:glycosyl transferase family 87
VDLRHPAPRAALLLALVVALAAAGPAAAQEPKAPPSQTEPPPFHSLSAREVLQIADRSGDVVRERRRRGSLYGVAYTKGRSRWQVGYFHGGGERVQVIVDDRTGDVLESWTGEQVRWRMARGYEGAFGRKLNAPYVWIPLCVLFLAPFVDPRRPFRLLHLDLLVLLGFSVSHVFFNRGEIGLSVPLVYPVLAYLLVRMLATGFRGRERVGRVFPVVPVVAVAMGLLFLVGFRIALNVTDSRVIDVGYSGVIGADRITDGRGLYGDRKFARDNEHGDTYGPITYLLYVPFEQVWPWSGQWDDLPAAHAAAIAFDVLTLLGLLVLGRRLRAGPEGTALGIGLAYAWAAYPYTLFALQSNSNDSLVAMLLVWALVAQRSPPARGALVALAAAAKFSPAALLPLFARGRRREVLLYSAAVAVILTAVFLPFLPDGGIRALYDRTVGYQLGRDSPFSIWGQADALAPLHTALEIGVAALALLVAFVPRRPAPAQVAALAAAVIVGVQLVVTHWFYLYVVWFAPLVFVALLAPLRASAAGGEALGPGLGLDARGVDRLRDQPVPAGAHHQLQ